MPQQFGILDTLRINAWTRLLLSGTGSLFDEQLIAGLSPEKYTMLSAARILLVRTQNFPADQASTHLLTIFLIGLLAHAGKMKDESEYLGNLKKLAALCDHYYQLIKSQKAVSFLGFWESVKLNTMWPPRPFSRFNIELEGCFFVLLKALCQKLAVMDPAEALRHNVHKSGQIPLEEINFSTNKVSHLNFDALLLNTEKINQVIDWLVKKKIQVTKLSFSGNKIDARFFDPALGILQKFLILKTTDIDLSANRIQVVNETCKTFFSILNEWNENGISLFLPLNFIEFPDIASPYHLPLSSDYYVTSFLAPHFSLCADQVLLVLAAEDANSMIGVTEIATTHAALFFEMIDSKGQICIKKLHGIQQNKKFSLQEERVNVGFLLPFFFGMPFDPQSLAIRKIALVSKKDFLKCLDTNLEQAEALPYQMLGYRGENCFTVAERLFAELTGSVFSTSLISIGVSYTNWPRAEVPRTVVPMIFPQAAFLSEDHALAVYFHEKKYFLPYGARYTHFSLFAKTPDRNPKHLTFLLDDTAPDVPSEMIKKENIFVLYSLQINQILSNYERLKKKGKMTHVLSAYGLGKLLQSGCVLDLLLKALSKDRQYYKNLTDFFALEVNYFFESIKTLVAAEYAFYPEREKFNDVTVRHDAYQAFLPPS